MTDTANAADGPANPVAEMAAQREAGSSQAPMTVAEAIDDALWLRRTPDGHMDTAKMRRVVATLLSGIESSTCFLKALKNGEEVFVLRMSDRAAIRPIFLWADVAEAHGCLPEKVADARAIATRWHAQAEAITRWPT